MKYYDADYIIRKNSEYEDLREYNSPYQIKLRKMIKEATEACKKTNEKCKLQKAKLEARKREKLEKMNQDNEPQMA